MIQSSRRAARTVATTDLDVASEDQVGCVTAEPCLDNAKQVRLVNIQVMLQNATFFHGVDGPRIDGMHRESVRELW